MVTLLQRLIRHCFLVVLFPVVFHQFVGLQFLVFFRFVVVYFALVNYQIVFLIVYQICRYVLEDVL